MKCIHLLLIGMLCACCISIQAQEQIGLRVENYAGVESLTLNPAWQTTNPLSWDLNLVSVGQFVDNNYGFVANANLFDIIANGEDIKTPIDDSQIIRDGDLVFDFNNSDRRKFVSVFTQVRGPSLSLRINKENYIGIFTNLRFAASAQNIPKEFNYYNVIEEEINEDLTIPKVQFATMAWSEFGINYARKIETYSGSMSFGINLKFLNGYEGGFFQNRRKFEFAQLEGDTIRINTPDVTFGYTNTNFNEEEGVSNDFERKRNGGGVAVDLGFTYIMEGEEDDYKLKLGASIMDLGRIKFSNNTSSYTLSFDASTELSTSDYSGYTNPDSLVERIRMDLIDSLDINTVQARSDFSIWMPAAFSLQADYKVMPMFYVNGLLIQRFPAQKAAIQRGNLLAITPRFEHRWGAFSLPISLYNYEHFNVGAAIRLAFLTIGTENLGSLIGNSNFTGTDFYVGLKINPFDIGIDFGGWGNGKNVKCYDF